MGSIISVSRRTDVPAFYGAWFLNRLNEGVAGWENPFSGRKYLVSLKAPDVTAFAFWSKNYRPFLPVLNVLKARCIPVFFNYTITGLPQAFESNLVAPGDAVDNLAEISRLYSPEHINWRYDPIIISSLTPPEFHEECFAGLCEKLRGKVKRCYFSYAVRYGKVARNFHRFEAETGVAVHDPLLPERIALARRLWEVAAAHDIEMFSCCGDYLLDGRVRKAHCIDGDVISRLYYAGCRLGRDKPMRKECGCAESIDIGKYDTCPHGCVYCYANINKDKADKSFQRHDPDAVFLGCSKEESDKVVAEKKRAPPARTEQGQLELKL